jgi:predicted kinase
MVKQPDHKPRLILLAGLPGAGKTTLAAELGRKLQWTVLDKDLLKLTLLKLQLGMPEEETGRIAYELLFVLAEDILMRQRSSVILDTSAHRLFILEEATRIAHVAGVQLKTILCTASSDLRRERLNERISSMLHHQFMNSMETTTIENDLEYFKHLPKDILIIETCNPLEDCLKKAIQYLVPSEKILDK